MRKCIDFLKQSPIITGVIGVVVAVGGMKILSAGDGDLLKMFALRVLLFLSTCVFIYLVSREKAFENCHTTTGYVVKWEILTLFYPIVMLPVNFILGKSPAVNWLIQLILSVIVCLFVGLYEEAVFRVLINDAILYKFRNSKHVFVWIAIVSSFVFGAVHVITPSIFSSPLAFGTAMLKIIQTGLYGFCLLIMYWKTRNILGIALAHAIYDGLTVVPGAILNDTSDIGSADMYVNSGSTGMILYMVLIVVIGVAAAIIWRKVGREIDFDEIRKAW